MASWYLLKNGNADGRWDASDSKNKISEGELTKDNNIFRVGEKKWVKVGDIPDFREFYPGGTQIATSFNIDNSHVAHSHTDQSKVDVSQDHDLSPEKKMEALGIIEKPTG